MAFGEHLCAYQNAGLALLDEIQVLFEGFFSRGAITVNANDGCVPEMQGEDFLYFFCALSQGMHFPMMTLGALMDKRLLEIAMVADKPLFAFVVRETGITVGAGGQPCTFITDKGRAVTAPVDENQH